MTNGFDCNYSEEEFKTADAGVEAIEAVLTGSYTISGHGGNELKDTRKLIGYHIEDPGLYHDMTAYQNLKCKCIQRGILEKNDIGLALVDIMMPKTDGYHVIKKYGNAKSTFP